MMHGILQIKKIASHTKNGVNSREQIMKSICVKSIGSTIIVGAFLFLSCGCNESNKSVESSTTDDSNNYQEQIEEELEKKECSYCKGTGIFTCTSCGGTGTDNLGIDCICVTYVKRSEAVGKKALRTALRWTCEYCDGTGNKK